MKKTWITAVLMFSLVLSGCAGGPQSTAPSEEEESSPWDCDFTVDAFGEGTYVCGSVSRSFEGSTMVLVLYCSSRTDSEASSNRIDPSWVQAHFGVRQGGRAVDMFSRDKKIEVSLDGGPKREMKRQDLYVRNGFQVYTEQPAGLGHKTTGDEQMQFLWGKSEITLRTADGDGKIHSGRISLEKMDEALQYLAFLGGCSHHVKTS